MQLPLMPILTLWMFNTLPLLWLLIKDKGTEALAFKHGLVGAKLESTVARTNCAKDVSAHNQERSEGSASGA